MSQHIEYDYIIAGAGCAGLSLAVHMIHSGRFTGKKILLVDQDLKTSNDRTWCFWQTGESLFESIVYQQWQRLWFYGDHFAKELAIAPYHYKMIRGIDFYHYCLDKIRAHPNFTIRFEKVDHVFSDGNFTGVIVNKEAIHCHYVFNSILFQKPGLTEKQYWLLQHFKGLVIETKEKEFDAGVATLMDFRADQKEGTAFCYVLPFSSHKALIEYTIFSPQLIEAEKYNQALQKYIRNVLRISSYQIKDEEFGVIPMTNFRFSPYQNNIINIGTAGGQTKGSSGYTFNFIQKHSSRIIEQLSKTGKPFLAEDGRRFAFYDSVLLRLLYTNALPGKSIFTHLFKKNRAQRLLRFLDNETSIIDDLRIISTLPVWPFTKAALHQIV